MKLFFYTVLLLSAYVIPYTLLRPVTYWWGSFLYWGLFTVTAFLILVWMTSSWRDAHE